MGPMATAPRYRPLTNRDRLLREYALKRTKDPDNAPVRLSFSEFYSLYEHGEFVDGCFRQFSQYTFGHKEFTDPFRTDSYPDESPYAYGQLKDGRVVYAETNILAEIFSDGIEVMVNPSTIERYLAGEQDMICVNRAENLNDAEKESFIRMKLVFIPEMDFSKADAPR